MFDAGPYLRYASKMFGSVSANLPAGTPVYEVSKVLGGMWRALPEEEKQPFVAAKQAELAELQKVGVRLGPPRK